MNHEERKLALSGSHNTRDIGGYPTKDGKVTRSHTFLRSDSIHELTAEDKKVLMDYGVKCIIDLRAELETQQNGYVFPEEIKVINYSLLDQIQSSGLTGVLPESMEEMYIGLLEKSKETIKKIFTELASWGDDCVLYHCTAGKDRTGITSMLLLWLAGVSEELIAEDYALTDVYLADFVVKQKAFLEKMGVDVPAYIWESKKEYMEYVLKYMNEKYGTCENYLKDIGLQAAEIDALKKRIAA